MKLKQILENMNKMPSTLKGFNDTPKLTAEQKSKLMNMVSRYNEFGQKLKMENSLIETATALSEIAELAETYACNEAQDWFATEVVKGDFKRARGVSETFQKLARECHGKVQQLNALYEDMGHILNRYYEIADPMNEVCPNPLDVKSQRGLPNAVPAMVGEVNHNDKNIKSQRQLPANGPIKEVAVDDKHANIKGQRDLPSGGPAPAQVKEVAVDDKHANIKGQRELPHTGGPATPQVKESAPVVNKPAGTPPTKFPLKTAGTPPQTPTQGEVREVNVDAKHANVKSQRNLPAGGPTFYNPPKDPKDTGSVKEVTHNESNLQSQRELPQGGPESYTYEKIENPSVAVNPAGAGECNVKGERDVPQGGPSKDVVYKGQNESMSLSEILKSMKK